MKKTVTILFLLIFTFYGCNDQKTVEQEKTPTESEAVSQDFKVKMSFASDKEDEISFRVTGIKKDEFQTKDIEISEKTLPTNGDEILVNFGDNNFSKTFYINLGRKTPKTFVIKSLELSYRGNSLVINKNEIEKYFRTNIYINYDISNGEIKTFEENGKLNPVLTLKRNAFNMLTK